MQVSEYEAADGLELAGRLRRGEVSPIELMDCAIALADERNPAVNALCHVDVGLGRELASKAELKGAFGALPFLLKDSSLAWTRLPSSIGSALFAGLRSRVDATLTRRFLDSGLLPFARTTVPEFCMAPTTEARQNGGPTRNPWDPTRSPGGSSGGAAAAVALGIVPIAHGSDGGGSIRIPASCCGVYGLKPSRGLVPLGPTRGEGWGGLVSDGVLSRTVRDTAAALDGFAGMELGQPYAAPARPPSYLDLLDRPFDRPLRIAKWTRAWGDTEIAGECREAIDAAEQHLRALGHDVVEAPPPDLNYDAFIDAIIDVMAANVVTTVNGVLRTGGDTGPLKDLLEPAILDAYQLGGAMRAETYVLAINRFHAVARTMETYLQDFDLVLSPTPHPPPAKLGELSMDDDFKSFRRKAGRYTTFLAVINASGQPAASVPLHWSEGLPIGIQLVGRFGEDSTVLRISAQLEAAAPWHGHFPAKAARAGAA